MKTTYRKDGWTSRLERTSRSEAWIVLSESGMAEMEGNRFTSTCTGQAPPPRSQGSRLRFLARQISNDLPASARISRMTLSEGRADHHVETVDGTREWAETFGRLHLAVAAGPFRTTIDRGGSSLSSIDPAEIGSLTRALVEARSLAGAGVWNVRLTPPVMARILRALVDAVLLGGLPAGLEIVQMDHEDYPYDGWGRPIRPIVVSNPPAGTTEAIAGAAYRPTYRLPPIALPFHIRLVGRSEPLDIGMRAIEILDPFVVTRERLTAGLLCLDPENRPLATCLAIDPSRLLGSIRSVGNAYRWFPHSAGAYGSDTDVEGVELTTLDPTQAARWLT